MELTLQRERFTCFLPLPVQKETCEESSETAIPDYCPDITRVVDASGTLFVRESEIREGKITVSGTIRVTLLYVSEGSAGLKSFLYSIPFSHTAEGRAENATDVCTEGRLRSIEVRPTGARKILIRAVAELEITPYRPNVLFVCGGVEEQAHCRIEMKLREETVSLIRGVRDRDFCFTDSVPLRTAAREILKSAVHLRLDEVRTVGNKVILKGTACMDVLCMTEDGVPQRVTEELPFSEVIEGMDGGEGSEYSVSATLRLSASEVALSSEESPALSVKLCVNAFLLLRRSVTLRCVSDLYSITHELQSECEEYPICGEPEIFTRTESVREKVETGSDVSQILCADVTFSETAVQPEENAASWRTTANIRVLYTDAGGVPLSAQRQVSIAVQNVPRITPRVLPVCPAEITAVAAADGVEVRFPVIFSAETTQCRTLCTYVSLTAQEDAPGTETRPSIVLRVLATGEELWDLAKRYRTTVEEILRANDFASEAAVPPGKLLLIPRKR